MGTAAEFLARDDDDSVSLGLVEHALRVRELGRKRNRRAAERALTTGGPSSSFTPHGERVTNGVAGALLLAALLNELE